MRRILLLGKNGQLGWELQRALAPLGELIPVGKQDLDITSSGAIRKTIRETSPNVIINSAAYNDVDGAERHKKIAVAVNQIAPLVVAEEANRLSSLIIYYSTDYVFDGTKSEPYHELDTCSPLNYYGYTKREGEKAVCENSKFHFVFRTSWMFSLRRDNFVIKILRWAREKETLRVVDDQTGSPTWARMLAELTSLVLMQSFLNDPDWLAERSGIYHLAGSGAATRFEWAQAILALDSRAEEQRCKQLLPAKTDEFPTPARRPAYSALDCRKFEQTFGLRIPPWRESLAMAMDTSLFSG